MNQRMPEIQDRFSEVIDPVEFYPPLRGGGYEVDDLKLNSFLRFLSDSISEGRPSTHTMLDLREMAQLISIDPLEIERRLGSTLQQENGLYKMMWPVDLYVHIPFCNSTCMYCPFYKVVTSDQDKISNYLRSIVGEISIWKEVLDFSRLLVNSIYMGGGTPTILDLTNFELVFENLSHCEFKCHPQLDVNVEASPSTVPGPEYLSSLLAIVRTYFPESRLRISLGIQSLDDKVLSAVKRRSTREDGLAAIHALRDFLKSENNVSGNVDILVGLPLQTADSVVKDIDEVMENGIPSITVEQLQVYPNTALSKHRHRFRFLEDAEKARLVRTLFAILLRKGYRPNVTNLTWALPGHQRRYKTEVIDTLALGASAGGKMHLLEYENVSSILQYGKIVEKKVLPITRFKVHDYQDLELFYIRNAFSLLREIDRNSFRQMFGVDFVEKYANEVYELLGCGFVGITDGRVLMREGTSLFDILRKFVKSQEMECIERFNAEGIIGQQISGKNGFIIRGSVGV